MERRNLRRWLCMLALMIAVSLLAACGADCWWSGRGEAWIDQNEDGVRNSDELPLAGVKFRVESSGPMIGAKDGSVDFYIFLPGCPEVDLEVYVDTPAGYRLTTEPRVHASEEGEVVRFGFAPVKDQNP